MTVFVCGAAIGMEVSTVKDYEFLMELKRSSHRLLSTSPGLGIG
jgi:hypothetical protein